MFNKQSFEVGLVERYQGGSDALAEFGTRPTGETSSIYRCGADAQERNFERPWTYKAMTPRSPIISIWLVTWHGNTCEFPHTHCYVRAQDWKGFVIGCLDPQMQLLEEPSALRSHSVSLDQCDVLELQIGNHEHGGQIVGLARL